MSEAEVRRTELLAPEMEEGMQAVSEARKGEETDSSLESLLRKKALPRP